MNRNDANSEKRAEPSFDRHIEVRRDAAKRGDTQVNAGVPHEEQNRLFDPETGLWTSQLPLAFDAGDTEVYRYVEVAFEDVDSDPTAPDDRYVWTGRESEAETGLQYNRVGCCRCGGDPTPGVWLGEDGEIVNAAEASDRVADVAITIFDKTSSPAEGDNGPIEVFFYDEQGNRLPNPDDLE